MFLSWTNFLKYKIFWYPKSIERESCLLVRTWWFKRKNTKGEYFITCKKEVTKDDCRIEIQDGVSGSSYSPLSVWFQVSLKFSTQKSIWISKEITNNWSDYEVWFNEPFWCIFRKGDRSERFVHRSSFRYLRKGIGKKVTKHDTVAKINHFSLMLWEKVS